MEIPRKPGFETGAKNREIFQVQIILLKYLYFNIFDFQDESMVNELVRVIGFAKTIILKKFLGH